MKHRLLLSIWGTCLFGEVGHLPGLDEGHFHAPRAEASLLGCADTLRFHTTNGQIPSVKVVGEWDHSDPTVEQQREHWIRKGLAGEVILGVEGATAANSAELVALFSSMFNAEASPDCQIFGMEQEASHALAGLLKLNRRYRPSLGTASLSYDDWEAFNAFSVEQVLVPMFRMYSSLRKAWLQMPQSPLLDKPFYEALTTWVRALEDGKNAKDLETQLLKSDRGYSIGLGLVLHDFIAAYAQYLRANPSALGSLPLPKDFPALVQKVNGHFPVVDPELFIVQWRNYSFLPTIQIALEKAATNHKPLVLIVGNAHVEFLKAQLVKAP